MEAQSFDDWWAELKNLAAEDDWSLGEKESYHEFYDDGDTPADALEVDMESCDGRSDD
jgi:hypothetical protein